MKSLAVFASGTGTNFVAIATACAQGVIDARVALLVCDKPGAPVLDRAKELGVETFVFCAKDYPSKAHYEAEIVKRLDERKVDLVCLAGYMRIVGETLLQAYEGKIINIRPSGAPMPWNRRWLMASRCMASPSTGSTQTWTAARSLPSVPSPTKAPTPPKSMPSARK